MAIERLLAIVGPTASGKTALSLEIARRFDGEIIAADSRTVYRGMDIGTAKPTAAEQELASHHLLDVADPDQGFSVAEFKKLAEAAISAIRRRGHLPILVGGTGLYVDAVLYDFELRAVGHEAALRDLPLEELQRRARQQGIELNASDQHNRRRLVRALASGGEAGRRSELAPGTLIVGLRPSLEALRAVIERRVDQMVAEGFEAEVRRLVRDYPNAEALTGIGYRAFARAIDGEITLEEAKQEFIRGDYQLAKRQLTWFKRNPDIRWFNDATRAASAIAAWMVEPL